ncbi:hypothetical protein [Nocardia sp. NPDC060249]|uniref:hypothetical protein n=1 Tax=Nocardia sp. NPDC060249 TaxID=3347082 RepID=UPI003646E6A7
MLHDWRHDIGHNTADRSTETTVSHELVEHMGLYIATGTRAQLSLLAAALAFVAKFLPEIDSSDGVHGN